MYSYGRSHCRYFNAGEFRFPVSGFTHGVNEKTVTECVFFDIFLSLCRGVRLYRAAPAQSISLPSSLFRDALWLPGSAYRYHEMDPLRFTDGVRMAWRCGDIGAAAPNGGHKCFAETLAGGGHKAGNPTCDHVISYAWVYVW